MISAYLYFYSETPVIPDLLKLSVSAAALAFEKIYLSVSKQHYHLIKSAHIFPENVIIDEIESDFFKHELLAELQVYYKDHIIKSNSPHIELHCINRWLHLKKRNMFDNQHIFSIDWDTIVFKGISQYFDDLSGIDLAATNLASYNFKYEPIWALCPNMLFLSKYALDYYIFFLQKYICYSRRGKSIIKGNFCDMHPWSSVISLSISSKVDLRLLNFNDYISSHPAIDHNFRVMQDCGSVFKSHKYYLPSNADKYIPTDYLLAKELIFSPNGKPYFLLDVPLASENISFLDKKWLKEVACVHFSGVEAKYILFSVFLEDILRNLR